MNTMAIDIDALSSISSLKRETIAALLQMATGQEHGIAYFCRPGHPLAHKGSGKVYLSRLIASSLLGRWLRPNELVRFRDGNPGNLQPKNLEIITRAEHMRRNRLAYERNQTQSVELLCAVCGGKFSSPPSHAGRRVTCSERCRGERRRRFTLEAIELRVLVWTQPAVEVGRLLGVSDRAIGKRCAALGIPKPARGDWQRYRAGYFSELDWFERMCRGLDDDAIEALEAALEKYAVEGSQGQAVGD
ncbi:MAG: HNH endonuclease [Chloroflexota bacterium]